MIHPWPRFNNNNINNNNDALLKPTRSKEEEKVKIPRLLPITCKCDHRTDNRRSNTELEERGG